MELENLRLTLGRLLTQIRSCPRVPCRASIPSAADYTLLTGDTQSLEESLWLCQAGRLGIWRWNGNHRTRLYAHDRALRTFIRWQRRLRTHL